MRMALVISLVVTQLGCAVAAAITFPYGIAGKVATCALLGLAILISAIVADNAVR